MKLAESTWPQVEAYLQKKKTIILPIGSTEQHGPNGLFNTDFGTSEHLAIAVGEKTQTLVAPPLPFGMAQHHLGFAGTCSLTPSTMMLVIQEMISSFAQNGFTHFLFINGHGGNINPVATAFCEYKVQESHVQLQLENWWRMEEVQKYEQEHFGKANGFHATCGEVSLTMHLYPEAYKKIPKQNFEIEDTKYLMPLSAADFRKKFPDGRMGSNPGLATPEHGKNIFNLAVSALVQRLQSLEKMT